MTTAMEPAKAAANRIPALAEMAKKRNVHHLNRKRSNPGERGKKRRKNPSCV
jgi:hypothetical protein